MYHSNMQAGKTDLLSDRILIIMRWLTLVGLVLGLSWENSIGRNAAILVLVTGIWNAVLMAVSIAGLRLPRHKLVNVALDSILALLFLQIDQTNALPFTWAGLLPVISGAYYFGLQKGVVIAFVTSLLEGAILTAQLGNATAIQVITIPALVMIATGLVVGLFSQVVAGVLRTQEAKERSRQEDIERLERNRVNALYKITSNLTSTLNYERVLEMALDLTATVLSTTSEPITLVSAFFLFDEDEMFVGSARRFTPSDLRVTFPAKQGIIAETLQSGQPRMIDHPERDPEIQRVVALRSCGTIYVYPLRTSQESFGVLVFGHPDKDYFDKARTEILDIVGRQALVAMQNARLYRDLEQEKERMTEIQEEARKKLARNLHDGPTQSVAALAMRVNFARRLIERDPRSAAEELYKIEDLARRTTKEIRHMLFTLRPLVLETSGLIAALESMAQKTKDTYDQNVTIEAAEEVVKELEIGKQGVIFYIVEEAVNNARKHAEAQDIWVRLKKVHTGIVLLEIEDNGVGFNVGEVDAGYEKRGSLGMVNMRERTELINGVLQLNSEVGKGTRIRVWIPLDEDASERLRNGQF